METLERIDPEKVKRQWLQNLAKGDKVKVVSAACIVTLELTDADEHAVYIITKRGSRNVKYRFRREDGSGSYYAAGMHIEQPPKAKTQ